MGFTGLKALIDFLSDLWENGFPSRLPIGERAEDPDFRAEVSLAVEAELEVAKNALKPVVQEIIRTEVKIVQKVVEVERIMEKPVDRVVEKTVYVDREPEHIWEEWRLILQHDKTLNLPLIRMAVMDHSVGDLDFTLSKWLMDNRPAAYKQQKAIIDAVVEKQRADRAKVRAEREAQREVDAGQRAPLSGFEDDPEKQIEARRKHMADLNRVIMRLQGYMGKASQDLMPDEYSAIARAVVRDRKPEAREKRIGRLINVCLKGKGKDGCWQPKNLRDMLMQDAISPLALPREGEEREMQMGM